MEQEKDQKPKEKVLKVKALMFIRACKLAGTPELKLLMREGSTTAECVTKITGKFPALEAIQDCIVVALDYKYVTDLVKVKVSDKLAVIPPINDE